jgi:hypothetical protein
MEQIIRLVKHRIEIINCLSKMDTHVVIMTMPNLARNIRCYLEFCPFLGNRTKKNTRMKQIATEMMEISGM